MVLNRKPDIPATVLSRWQRIVDLLASITHTPATLITKTHKSDLELLVCNDSANNPYDAHYKVSRNRGLYCDWVIDNKQPLLISDAKLDPEWHSNPDLIHNFSFYCGYPLHWPDNDIFGTLCVLDQFDNKLAERFFPLMQEFQLLLESDLALVLEQEQLQAKNLALEALVERKREFA